MYYFEFWVFSYIFYIYELFVSRSKQSKNSHDYSGLLSSKHLQQIHACTCMYCILLFIHSLGAKIFFKLTNVACKLDFKNTYNYTTFTTISSEKTERKTNKQLAPYFCSIFFPWCEFFSCEDKNRFFDVVSFFFTWKENAKFM